MKALDEKLTLAMFAMLNSKEEKELIRAVDDRHGREAVIGSDELLKQVVLIGQKMDEAWNVSATSSDGGKTLGPIYMSALLEDLKTDVEKAVEKNIMQFNRNLNAQMRVLEAEVKEVVHREGDRVISAVISGPHDGILDPDLYNIWKDMVSSIYFYLSVLFSHCVFLSSGLEKQCQGSTFHLRSLRLFPS